MYHKRVHPSVESNAARSPSKAGQHPHMVKDDREHNPQQMYEGRKGHAYKQMGAVPPTSAPPADDFWGKALALGAMGLLAYLVLKPERRQNPESEEEVIERTARVVEHAPPAPPTVVVVPPSGVSVTAQQPALLPAAQQVAPVAHPVVEIPQPVLQPSVESVKVVDAVVVEDKASKKRQRKTTQARDEKGHYLPAGTRGRSITEGKG